jgi:hypothetical protein
MEKGGEIKMQLYFGISISYTYTLHHNVSFFSVANPPIQLEKPTVKPEASIICFEWQSDK